MQRRNPNAETHRGFRPEPDRRESDRENGRKKKPEIRTPREAEAAGDNRAEMPPHRPIEDKDRK